MVGQAQEGGENLAVLVGDGFWAAGCQQESIGAILT